MPLQNVIRVQFAGGETGHVQDWGKYLQQCMRLKMVIKDKNALDVLSVAAPLICQIIGKDMMMSVTNTEKFLTYVKGNGIDVG